MHRRAICVVLAVSCSATCQTAADDSARDVGGGGLPVTHAPQREARAKLSPHLRRVTAARGAGDKLRVLVDLSPQLDLIAFGEVLRRQGADRRGRRRLVVAGLQRVAARSQGSLRPLLDELRRSGSIDSYRGFSVLNRLVVTASPAAIFELAKRDEVVAIVEETTRDALVLTGAAQTAASPPLDTSWALDAIGVESLWEDGVKGRGIVVGIIDTGASASHEQMRGNFHDSSRSWYDPSGRSSVPQDSRTGHGTTILSVAVGENPQGRILGVAPEAEWIACAGLPEGRYNNIMFTECADWMLNVGQPDVLINAWLLPSRGCDGSLHRIVDAWRAAEILPVFSAGNDGPTEQSGRSPANYVGLYPGDGSTLSVGGTARSRAALPTSSRGPSSCDGSIFPALVAPAEGVTAAFPLTPSTYTLAQGTSVAAGLVAGAAALLLRLYPQATIVDVEEALKSSAIDLGPAGPDDTYGYGHLYLPTARDSLGRLLRRKQETRGAGPAGRTDPSAATRSAEPSQDRAGDRQPELGVLRVVGLDH